jgi:transglycosylase-like protein with SLT domain
MAQKVGGMRAAGVGMLAAVAVAVVAAAPCPAADKAHDKPHAAPIPTGATVGHVAVEMVYFANPQQRPVRLLRGVPPPAAALIQRPAPRVRPVPTDAHPQSTQIVSFGTGFVSQVKVVRGGSFTSASLTPRGDSPGFNRESGVSVLRGAAIRELFSIDLFAPADGGELDRIAFAVDGIESRHGADPRMWRPSLTGPQGPMQVTAAAAFDVGGGDRFDLTQNRLLGRAYLAQMYRRYGNWPDAIAAYNWGPGNMDLWITGGRNTDQLPFDVARYVALVMRDALVTARR